MIQVTPTSDKPSKLENLFVELVNKGFNVTIDNDEKSIGIFLENWIFTIYDNGKWDIL